MLVNIKVGAHNFVSMLKEADQQNFSLVLIQCSFYDFPNNSALFKNIPRNVSNSDQRYQKTDNKKNHIFTIKNQKTANHELSRDWQSTCKFSFIYPFTSKLFKKLCKLFFKLQHNINKKFQVLKRSIRNFKFSLYSLNPLTA